MVVRQSVGRSLRTLLVVCAAALFVGLAAPGPGRAQDVEAVLSSDLGPYHEAFEGFLDGFGSRVTPRVLSRDFVQVAPTTRVVVAFGAKAALLKYPEHVILIYCMSPGVPPGFSDQNQSAIEIEMFPRTERVLDRMKEFQPNLKRLAVIWSSKSMQDDVEDIRAAVSESSVEILSERLNGPNDLPDLLRAVNGKVDALWLLPDPLLVNAQSLSVLKEFSWSNHVPFYAPMGGLVEQGATVSISSNFREMGRAAGQAARRALFGTPTQHTIYPEKIETMLSVKAAANAGLQISPQLLKTVDKSLP